MTETKKLPSENYVYYKYKNEKKRHSIKFEKENLKLSELKNFISSHSTDQKDSQSDLYDIQIYDEQNNMKLTEDSCEIKPDSNLLIEKVPWYKIKKIDKNTQENSKKIILTKDEILKQFTCQLCSSSNPELEFYMTTCCGESACENCLLKKYITNNILNNEEQIKDTKLADNTNCPFCSLNFINSNNSIILSKRVNELKEYLLTQVAYQDKNDQKMLMNYSGNRRNSINSYYSGGLSENLGSTMINTTPISNQKLIPSNYINMYLSIQANYNSNIQQGSELNPAFKSSSLINPYLNLLKNSRYFIIKSTNKENIEISQKHNEWATTVTNQQKLNEAFRDKNIILLFSVNKSGYFQGYAIMKSYISDKVSSLWNNDSYVKLGGTFQIQWLCATELPFSKVKHLTNPLNNNETVVKGRDTQELPMELGFQICSLSLEQEKYESQLGTKKQIFNIENVNKLSEEIRINRENKFNLETYLGSRKISLDESKSKILIYLC